jgi:PAS domain S-box-containing protein
MPRFWGRGATKHKNRAGRGRGGNSIFELMERRDPLNIPWSQDLIKNLIEVIKTGIFIIDSLGNISFANQYAAELLGYTRDELNGRSLETFFFDEDRQIFLPNILKMTRENSGFDGEVLLSKRDGSSFYVNLSSVLYKESPTGREFIIFTIQDITYFKKMGQEQLESERFFGLGKMTDQISHQIRNPLTSIGGFALRLAREQTSREDYQRYTQIIQTEAKRLEHILDRLVEFARVQPAPFTSYTLPEIFSEAEKVDGQGNPSVHWPSPDTLVDTILYGNPGLILRAIQCLVQNALEACSDKAEISVTGEVKDNQVLVCIKDNGEGILQENLPFIFDPFFSSKFNYLGMGLTLAKRIAQVHNGQIQVDSLPGQGSEFRLLLPKDRRREIRTRLL